VRHVHHATLSALPTAIAASVAIAAWIAASVAIAACMDRRLGASA